MQILMVPLTPERAAQIHGWVNAGASEHPEFRKYPVFAGDGSDEFFWYIASQFGVFPPRWKVSRPVFDNGGVYKGPVDPDAMTPEDWLVFGQWPDLWNGFEIFAKSPVGHPNGQGPYGSPVVDIAAYVRKGGTFAPWFVKE